jgi:hypothetical protein
VGLAVGAVGGLAAGAIIGSTLDSGTRRRWRLVFFLVSCSFSPERHH